MTISIARPNSMNSERRHMSSTVQPAAVWDVKDVATSRRYPANVRTLEAQVRKDDLVAERMNVRREEAFENFESFETRREKRGAAAMGVLLGIGLFVGSALGGAFSGNEVDPAPAGTQDVVASIAR